MDDNYDAFADFLNNGMNWGGFDSNEISTELAARLYMRANMILHGNAEEAIRICQANGPDSEAAMLWTILVALSGAEFAQSMLDIPQVGGKVLALMVAAYLVGRQGMTSLTD